MEQKTLTLQEMMKKIGTYALGGAKVPHGVSNPVFRKTEDGTYAVAAFVFTFDREMLKNKTAHAPCEWILVNPADGALLQRISCSEQPFSSCGGDTVDLRAESDQPFSKEYGMHTISLFDAVLKKYTQQQVFDKGLNDAYMYMMLGPVSVGLKPYYRDLNLV